MPAVTVENAIKRFGSTLALDHAGINVEAGELFFLLGPSGCGKTTLLRSIAGFVTLDSGSIYFGDGSARKDVTRLAPRLRGAAMVFQSLALWPHMTAYENVAFGLRQRKLPREEIRARATAALEHVHLGAQAQRRPTELSGGQQQRVALARALVVRPHCLLLDEPLSSLDARLRLEMRDEIRAVCKREGLTAIYVTHDQQEALAVADRIAVMKDGKVVQVGSPREVYARPGNAFVADFLGRANFIAATARAAGDGDYVFESAAGKFRSAEVPEFARREGAPVTLVIRPELFQRQPDAENESPNGSGLNIVRGAVASSTCLGETTLWNLKVNDHAVEILELSGAAALPDEKPNEMPSWRVAPEHVMVMPAQG